MHDLNFIRENSKAFDEALKKRFIEPQTNKILELDSKKRDLLTKSQDLRSERKTLSSSFSKLNDSEKSNLQIKVQEIKINIDTMENEINNLETGNPNTQHSLNPVPCIVVDNNRRWKIINDDGGLSNISPTILKRMGIEKPKEMTTDSLIEEY